MFPDSLASRCIWEPGSCAKMHIQSVKTLYLSILYTVNDSEIYLCLVERDAIAAVAASTLIAVGEL